jgi:hypothetical protein
MAITPTPTGTKDSKGRELFDYFFDGDGLYEPATVRAFSEEYARSLWAGSRVQLPDKVIEIRCTEAGCGLVCGTLTLPANSSADPSFGAAEQGLIDDQKCDIHQAGAGQ